ncbi:MAG: YbaN family protein [Bacteroidales bacterium]|nr:YbaN family protein [Bacteroidales bacterium]
MIKLVLLILGFLSLALGIIGIFLPVLPTTPFVLLAAYLFGKSSEKFHQYLYNHRIFGPMVRDFYERKAMKRKNKVIALVSMWIVLLSSVIFFMPYWWAKVIVLCIGLGTTIYMVRFPEYKD